MNERTLVGLDCGKSISGITVITELGIRQGINVLNDDVIDFIMSEKSKCSELIVVVEDIRPYNMRITDGIIDTIKFIGQIEWRLKDNGVYFKLVPRWVVKQWVFTNFNDMAVPEITKKIEYSRLRKEKLGLPPSTRIQQPTFVYVDDRIVQKSMRIHWEIPIPKVGGKSMYGLKDHSWQALGLLTVYIVLYRPSFLLTADTV